jgi:hypothetical protein
MEERRNTLDIGRVGVGKGMAGVDNRLHPLQLPISASAGTGSSRGRRLFWWSFASLLTYSSIERAAGERGVSQVSRGEK